SKQAEERLKRQKDLHARFMSSFEEKLKNGPLQLPFYSDAKFPNAHWCIAKIKGEQLALDAIPSSAAPGLTKRLTDFTPQDQYQLYELVLPKPVTPEEHKAWAAYCMERELAAQAQ